MPAHNKNTTSLATPNDNANSKQNGLTYRREDESRGLWVATVQDAKTKHQQDGEAENDECARESVSRVFLPSWRGNNELHDWNGV